MGLFKKSNVFKYVAVSILSLIALTRTYTYVKNVFFSDNMNSDKYTFETYKNELKKNMKEFFIKPTMKDISDHTYVLMVTGISDEKRNDMINEAYGGNSAKSNEFWNNATATYNNLIKRGLDPNNIMFLYGSGKPNKDAKKSSKTIQNEFQGNYSNSTNQKNIQDIISEIKDRMKSDNSDKSKFLIFLLSEGYSKNDTSYVQLTNNKTINQNQLSNYLTDINEEIYIVVNACYAGAFSNEFSESNNILSTSNSGIDYDSGITTQDSFNRMFSRHLEYLSPENFKKTFDEVNTNYSEFNSLINNQNLPAVNSWKNQGGSAPNFFKLEYKYLYDPFLLSLGFDENKIHNQSNFLTSNKWSKKFAKK